MSGRRELPAIAACIAGVGRVERRNGKWLISEAGVFEDLKPDAVSVPPGN